MKLVDPSNLYNVHMYVKYVVLKQILHSFVHIFAQLHKYSDTSDIQCATNTPNH